MLRLEEKLICDDILRYGEIIRDERFTDEHGVDIRQYTIRDINGEVYDLTKRQGEWIYIFHYNNYEA